MPRRAVTIAGIPETLTAGNGYDLYVYLLSGTTGKGGGYRVLDSAGAVLKTYVLADCNANPTSYTEVPQNLAAGVHGVGNYIVFKGLKSCGHHPWATRRTRSRQSATRSINAVSWRSARGHPSP
jgi:hypothetical protein